MKQIALNFYEALKWLVGYRPKAMPLTNKWIELDKQEQYRIAQAKMWDENHAKKTRPFWHRKLNTNEKNRLKLMKVKKEFHVNDAEVVMPKHMCVSEQLEKIIAKNPEFFNRKKTMSDSDYIKCDGNQKKYFRDSINFYEPSYIHFSNDFILLATDSDLDLFDVEGDEDFRDWFFETRYKLINK